MKMHTKHISAFRGQTGYSDNIKTSGRMFYSNPAGCTIFFLLEKFFALHVPDVTASIVRSTTVVHSHRFFLWFWCVYSMEQVLALGQEKRILYIQLDLNKT
jgi:uncharacterized membrane protein